MPRKNKWVSNAADAKRNSVWAHNAKLGGVRMAETWMQTIIHSPTSSVEAQVIARTILNCIGPLREALKTRVDK